MTSVHTLIDDSSGKPIPKGARYYHVQVRRKDPERGSPWVYQDTQSYIAATNFIKRALLEARVRDEEPPEIHLDGRKHF